MAETDGLAEAVEWLTRELPAAFPGATFDAPLSGKMGCRLKGIDLRKPLSPEQAKVLVEVLPRFRVVCIPGQVRTPAQLRHLRDLTASIVGNQSWRRRINTATC